MKALTGTVISFKSTIVHVYMRHHWDYVSYLSERQNIESEYVIMCDVHVCAFGSVNSQYDAS